MVKKENSIPESEQAIYHLEEAAAAFLKNPTGDSYNTYVNWFANAIHYKSDVFAVMIAEEVPGYEDPIIRMNKITVGDKIYFGFYTSEKEAAKSDADADFVILPLDKVVELTLGEENIAGLIINPSQGRDASINRDLVKKCFDAVKNYKA